MRTPSAHQGIRLTTDRLIQILRTVGRVAEPCLEVSTSVADGHRVWDGTLRMGEHTFVIEWKGSGSLSQVTMAVHQLAQAPSHFPSPVIPLLAVPYMGESARSLCDQNGVNWLDLSGNGKIVAPGIFYRDLGHPNRFRRPGRPNSAFSPKASRIARQLLMDPGYIVRQHVLAGLTGLNEGHVSRIVGKLADAGLVERSDDGVKVVDADLLLDAWREEYRFDRHNVITAHAAARSGDMLVRTLAGMLDHLEVPYAVTGLPAAWLLARHAGFRLVTVYLKDIPSDGLLEEMGFREIPRGANTWLVVPKDEGVFYGSSRIEGIHCVHPIQVYLDLKGHPERAQEAADELRSRLLSREQDDR